METEEYKPNDISVIELIKVDYLNNQTCYYKDQHGTELRVQRKSDSLISLKLRFKDKNIKADPYYIHLPVKEDASPLNLRFENGAGNNKDVIDTALDMALKVGQHWIDMMYDLAYLNTDSQVIAMARGVDAETVSKEKLDKLVDYPELKEITGALPLIHKK